MENKEKKSYTDFDIPKTEDISVEDITFDSVDKALDEVVDQPDDTSNVVEGVITDCLKLNIRKEPDPAGDVIAEVPALTEVLVDMNESTSDFYKVCTSSGVEGFCMSKFVSLRH